MLFFFHIGSRQQDVKSVPPVEEAIFRRSTCPMRRCGLSETRSSWWWWLSWYDSSLWSLPGDTNYWSGKRCCFFLLFEVLKNGRGLVWEDVKQRLFLEWRRGLVLYNLQSTFLQFVSFLEFLILICIGFTLVSNVLDDCNTCDLWFVSIFPCDSAFLCATGRGHRTYVQRFKPRGAWRCVLHGLNFLKGCCE